MTSQDVIQSRLQTGLLNREIKESVYRLRKFLAGHEAAIGGSKMTLAYSGISKARRQNPHFPDFRISQHEEGVSNHTLTWINTLIKQTLIHTPEISFPDLDIEVSQVRESYLQDRLTACGWMDQQESLLYCYLVDGIGFAKLGLENNMPAFQWVDTLDVLWDIQAKFPRDYRFIAVHLRLTEDVAIDQFGAKVVQKIKNARKLKDNSECIIECIEYWDKDTLAYYAPNCSDCYSVAENPFGFIPFETLHGPIVPSMYSPLPHILGVLGAQVAHTEIQRTLIEQNKRLKPVIQIDPSAYTEESFRDFEESPEDNPILILNEGSQPSYAISQSPEKIGETLQIKRVLEEEIVRHLGVNPFSAGSPLNIELATEVTAIQGQSGLTAQSIAIDLAQFLSLAFRKLVRIGALYDEEPFRVRLQDDVVEFGPTFSIEPILKDDVYCSVSAGTFESEYTKVAKTMQLANFFLSDPEIANYPKLKNELRRMMLANYNIRDVDSLLKPEPELQQKIEIVKQIPLDVLMQMLQQQMTQAIPKQLPQP